MASDPVRVVGPVFIRQHIKAGNQFNGETPQDGTTELDPTYTSYGYVFAAGTKGGLFDPTAVTKYGFDKPDAVDLIGVEILFDGNTTAWKIEKISADATPVAVTLWEGTNEAQKVVLEPTKLTLIWGEKIRLTTTAATGTMSATLKFEPHT